MPTDQTITDNEGKILRLVGKYRTTLNRNNTIKPIHTDSTTVEVIVSEGRLLSHGSQFGHVAIEVDDLVYSMSHSQYFVAPSKTKYLEKNSYRDSVGLVLRVSPKEEEIIHNELKRRVQANSTYSIASNSCSTNVADVLEMVGILAHDPRYQLQPSSTAAVSPKDVLAVVSRSKRMIKRIGYPKK